MPKCTRQGCQKEFKEEENEDGACQYHPGGPVFHEGLKSWSCCKDVNKPVLDFESFMRIPGCTPAKHTTVKDQPVPKPVQTSSSTGSSTPTISMKMNPNGEEVFTSGPTRPQATTSSKPGTPPPPAPVIEDEDDVDVPVAPGTKCLRNGCKHTFVGQAESRGDGEQSQCVYHPKPPIFHEGSKGYLCCKRRVLEFDEFLRIEGCKTGKHVFVKKKSQPEGEAAEELVQCRIDHYQTPSQVMATIYAKKCDKDRSVITFESERIHLDLVLPDAKRFKKTLELYGPVKPEASSYKIYGTKVDLTLAKDDARSWSLLERSDADLAGFALTFGVGGRTGTVGGKEAIVDEATKIRG